MTRNARSVLSMVETEGNERIGAIVASLRGSTPQAAVAAQMVKCGHSKWSQSTVWAVEKGARPLRLNEAADLAAVLHCDVTDFLPAEGSTARMLRLASLKVRECYDDAVENLAGLAAWRGVLEDELEKAETKGREITPVAKALVARAESRTPERALEEGLRVARGEHDRVVAELDHENAEGRKEAPAAAFRRGLARGLAGSHG